MVKLGAMVRIKCMALMMEGSVIALARLKLHFPSAYVKVYRPSTESNESTEIFFFQSQYC